MYVVSDSYSMREEGIRSHFAMVPNLVDDAELTLKAYRLYGHIKRVAGEHGRCVEGVDAMAKKCKMSKPSVIEAKRELETKELISVTASRDRTKPDELVILDIWHRNAEMFASSQEEVTRSKRGNAGSQKEVTRNPFRGQKEVTKEEYKEEHKDSSSEDLPLDQLPDDTTTACLLLLKRVKGFPRNQVENAMYLGELRSEFPRVDARQVCRQYEIWHRDNPSKTKGFRGRLRNFFESASKNTRHLSAVGESRPGGGLRELK